MAQAFGSYFKSTYSKACVRMNLDKLDFSDFQVCIECIKGKQTNMRKKDTNRCSDVLELIHMDICGPFPTPWNGQQYFITFIDDYSRYGYLYLIHEKSQSLDVFKNFKAEVEKCTFLFTRSNVFGTCVLHMTNLLAKETSYLLILFILHIFL